MRTDFLLVADAAQVADGKLYLLGGAWNRIALPQFPMAAPLAVAVGLMVGWEETNQDHVARLTIDDEDGALVLGPIEMRFEVGRPAGTKPGEDQRVVMAVNGQVGFQKPGGYAVVVRLGEDELARTSFRVAAQ